MNVPIIVMVQGLYALRLWRRESAHMFPFADSLKTFVPKLIIAETGFRV